MGPESVNEPKRYYYEYNGAVQATLRRMRRFVREDETIPVGVGCDKEEADRELDAALSADKQ